MAYDTSTGKRLKTKDGTPLINWVHSILKKPNYNLKQCLFGHIIFSKFLLTIHYQE